MVCILQLIGCDELEKFCVITVTCNSIIPSFVTWAEIRAKAGPSLVSVTHPPSTISPKLQRIFYSQPTIHLTWSNYLNYEDLWNTNFTNTNI